MEKPLTKTCTWKRAHQALGQRIRAHLLKAFGDVSKVKRVAKKHEDGKSIVIGSTKNKKDVWDF